MTKHLILYIFLALAGTGLPGQSFTGDLEVYLNSLIDVLPGSSGNQFTQPDTGQIESWKEMISDLLQGELEGAREKAGLLNYRITDIEDPAVDPPARYYVVEEKEPRVYYWGTYVFNREPSRPGLVIQSPHPVYDMKTGYQGIFCYKRLGALALFFSGTHRCNHSSYSVCSGSTTVCGGTLESYRISDNAHNTRSVFQASTEVLFDEVPDTAVFVQLHGFGRQSGDPHVIMSNGTRITPDPDYISVLMSELVMEDNLLTFKVIHMDLDWTRLTAFTNTQGRYINGSSDPCTENAAGCSGRFIHIEQERTSLRDDSTGWHKMYRALERTFPARPAAVRAGRTGLPAPIRIYPNPAIGSIRIETGGPFRYSLFSLAGQCLLESSSGSNSTEVDLGTLAPGVYLVNISQAKVTRWTKLVVR